MQQTVNWTPVFYHPSVYDRTVWCYESIFIPCTFWWFTYFVYILNVIVLYLKTKL